MKIRSSSLTLLCFGLCLALDDFNSGSLRRGKKMNPILQWLALVGSIFLTTAVIALAAAGLVWLVDLGLN